VSAPPPSEPGSLPRAPRWDLLPYTEAARRRALLVGGDDEGLALLSDQGGNVELLAWARTRFGVFETRIVSAELLDAMFAQAEAGLTALSSIESAEVVETAAASPALTLASIGEDASPAARLVSSTLYDALRVGASDIHLESDPAGLAVKFRLDGVLTAMRRAESVSLAAQAMNRIKVMAELDISERRVPQDGRLRVTYGGRQIDVRVSVMPSIHGEDAVLRILDRQHLAESLAGLTLEKLGLTDPLRSGLRALCRRSHGMLLVTGPTGSGKTTTLYAAIAETHQSRDKIITIEDPVEYQLQGVLQIPVNEKKGLTFARGLRSILRHDPDKILVGEIRDSETAQIAVQSALTGHLVFTTVHANSVFDVFGRFEQFGVDPYTFSAAINGVLAQRLVRRICPSCAGASRSGSLGCAACRYTGFSGRFAVAELLTMTPALKSLVAGRAPYAQVQAEARGSGWRGMAVAAEEAVMRGWTTQEEVDRVVD
jgi:general secretion pathway protein E